MLGSFAGTAAQNGGSSTANSSPGTASTTANGNGGSATGVPAPFLFLVNPVGRITADL